MPDLFIEYTHICTIHSFYSVLLCFTLGCFFSVCDILLIRLKSLQRMMKCLNFCQTVSLLGNKYCTRWIFHQIQCPVLHNFLRTQIQNAPPNHNRPMCNKTCRFTMLLPMMEYFQTGNTTYICDGPEGILDGYWIGGSRQQSSAESFSWSYWRLMASLSWHL